MRSNNRPVYAILVAWALAVVWLIANSTWLGDVLFSIGSWAYAWRHLLITIAICTPMVVVILRAKASRAAWMLEQWTMREVLAEPVETQALRIAGLALAIHVPIEAHPRDAVLMAVSRGWVERRGDVLVCREAQT